MKEVERHRTRTKTKKATTLSEQRAFDPPLDQN